MTAAPATDTPAICSACHRNGFTLVEVLVAFAILGLGLGLFFNSLSSSSDRLVTAAAIEADHVTLSRLIEETAAAARPSGHSGQLEDGRPYDIRVNILETLPGGATLVRLEGQLGAPQPLRLETVRLIPFRGGGR